MASSPPPLPHHNGSNSTLNNNSSNSLFWQDVLLSFPEDHYGNFLYEILAPTLFALVTLLGMIGNLLVVYVICSRKKLRTLTNLLLLNLAIADLLFVLICPPFTAYQFATYHWPFQGILGNILCKLMHYLLNVTAYVTIYTLVATAVIRYMTIVHTRRTMSYRTNKFVLFIIIGIWVVMLLGNSPILASYAVQINPYGLPDCENYGKHYGKILYATFFVFAFVLPLIVIFALYLAIYIHINYSSEVYKSGTNRSQRRRSYASRLLVAVVITFVVCWFPVHVHLLMAYYSTLPESDVYRTAAILFNFLSYFNSAVNPVIYNFTSHDFRTSFRDALCCKLYEREDTNNGSMRLVTFHANSQHTPQQRGGENNHDNCTARTSIKSDKILEEVEYLATTSGHEEEDVVFQKSDSYEGEIQLREQGTMTNEWDMYLAE